MRTLLAVGTMTLLFAPAAAAEPVRAPEGIAHVEKMGSGPVDLVLIPGLACDWTVWREFMERNDDAYTMYAVTLAGFGGHEAEFPADAQGSPLLDGAVAGVAELIRMHELESPFVMGHSLGGHVALRMGIEDPGAIAGVVDVDGFVVAPVQTEMTPDQRKQFVETQFAPQMRQMGGDMWLQQFAGAAETMVQDEERAEELLEMMRTADSDAVAQYVIEMFLVDLRPALADLGAPTLVLAATPDMPGVSVDKAFWEESTANANNLELIFIERTRHFIMDDAPAALDERVAEFVEARD